VRIALATCTGVPPQFDDDELLAAAIRAHGGEARRVEWDDPATDWGGFDLVVIRSTWDYTWRRDEFLAWAEHVGDRLRNPPAVVRWNSDKRYMGDLEAAGLPVVPTQFVEPGGEAPRIAGEVAVKPTVSAGGRDTGRFGPDAHATATELVARIVGSGRTAMIQPYLQSVDRDGETALVFLAGELMHALRKRAVLRPDEVAPVRNDALGAAEAMYDPRLVTASPAEPEEVDVARTIVEHLEERFGNAPLIVRVDLARAADRTPAVMELEAIEPNMFLGLVPTSAPRVADAVLTEAGRQAGP
jgi:glutathione synthase/RimK-type ligase-like ATP-grasp enzyme